ncbi:MAG: ATP-dependent RecD-like DNA helicase [Spirochaetaceae bacterium]|nr:ATP-dependent RecD-like DNA helicase [Spirochaetaceae bacterium]
MRRVVYEQEESGFAVLVVQQPEGGGEAVAVGNLLGIKPGETVRLTGGWVEHPRYGRRFEAQSYATVAPRTVAGLEQYLGSGMVPGIGPGFARRIVGHFGLETLRVLDQASARLREVPGIGAARAGQVARAWHEQRAQRGTMLFLQSYGISAAHARRIWRQFGARARAVLQDDPYRLASHVPGMGFHTADRIAARLGIAPDSPQRIQAAALHQLAAGAAEGDVFLPEPDLRRRTADLTGLSDQRLVVQALAALCREGRVVCADLPAAGQPGAVAARYLPRLAAAETRAAARLAALLAAPARGPDAAVAAVAGDTGIELSGAQQAAAARLLRSKVGVLTGGPGTGKTTLVRWIAGSFRRVGARVALAAPTGRAAKRLEESTGQPASTIHRLLEFSPRDGTFTRTREHPLATDLVVVDEASMVDVVLLAALLDAVPDRCRVLFVGDADQLPSVGAGAVLADLALVAAIPTVRLAEVFRQSAASQIVRTAHAINRGEFEPAAPSDAGDDFYFIARREPEQVADTLERVVTTRIPRRFDLDPRSDIQVLSPMNRGPLGTAQLNARLRERLNPARASAPASAPASAAGSEAGTGDGARLRTGDRVLQTRNNYQLEVFNGDIGRVIDVDADAGAVRVDFAGRQVEYGGPDRDDLVLAYAISIHRSQGSEFPAVVIPVHTQHFVMLRRNLLYTAVTRGKRLVVLVGSEMAVSIAVRRGGERRRHSALAARVAAAAGAR